EQGEVLGRGGDDAVFRQAAEDVGGDGGRTTRLGAGGGHLQAGAELGDLAVQLVLAHAVLDGAALFAVDGLESLFPLAGAGGDGDGGQLGRLELVGAEARGGDEGRVLDAGEAFQP